MRDDILATLRVLRDELNTRFRVREIRLFGSVVHGTEMVNAIERIELFVAGMDIEAFREDDKTYSAVVRKLEQRTRIYLGKKWRGCVTG